MNVSSLPDDRTARARIRDEALRLFADRGPDAVTMREIAAAARVSPALVVRHYGSGVGLREAVDEHVAQVFEMLLAEVTRPPDGDAAGPDVPASLLDVLNVRLPPDSAIPAYLGRLLLAGGSVGSDLFRRLYAVSRDALAAMTASGTASTGADPEVRAAFLLVNDLAVLTLRRHLADVLDVDPLSAPGITRWGAEVLTIYRDGLGGAVQCGT